MTHLSNRERRRRERKVWKRALLASLAVHALIFLLWGITPVRPSPFAAAGPAAGDDRAAGGGMQAMNIRAPASVLATPPPIPVPDDVEIEPIEFDEELSVDASSVDGAALALPGPGLEKGDGQGDGGASGSGLFRLIPPSPRGMIIPPENDELKGKEVEIWVFVDQRGRVVADSTYLKPPTGDRDYNRRLIEEAAAWVFNPARKDGEPVATWYHYTFGM